MITNYFHCMNKNEFIAAPANKQKQKKNTRKYTHAHSNTCSLFHSFANTIEPKMMKRKQQRMVNEEKKR